MGTTLFIYSDNSDCTKVGGTVCAGGCAGGGCAGLISSTESDWGVCDGPLTFVFLLTGSHVSAIGAWVVQYFHRTRIGNCMSDGNAGGVPMNFRWEFGLVTLLYWSNLIFGALGAILSCLRTYIIFTPYFGVTVPLVYSLWKRKFPDNENTPNVL